MPSRKRFALLLFCLSLASAAFAAQITGTITNGTTNKPAAGDEVVLLSLSGGMQETSRAVTNAQGKFTLDVPDEGVQHLIRVGHGGANYFHAAPAGTTTADITVYDAAKKVDNIIMEGRVLQLQASGDGQLEVAEKYILRNESSPPRTKGGDQTFEITLPEGAQMTDGMAAGPSGMPVTNPPVPTGKKNHFAFTYPLRPGRTQLQVIYKIPYKGSYDFNVTPETTIAEFGVLLPKSMKFTPSSGGFSQDNDEAGMNVFFTKSVAAGQQVKFTVQGEGTAPRDAQGGGGGGGGGGGEAGRPGGGLGAPIEAPDPLSKSRWYIIIGFAVVLVAGAYFVLRRVGPAGNAPAAPAANPRPSGGKSGAQAYASPAAHAPSSSGPGGVLEALKEELFQLETDRLQGKITQQEYEVSKTGLETLLRRQINKAGKKS